MKRKYMKLALLVGALSVIMCGCCIQHDWVAATCTNPETCSKCGKTQGEALGHDWSEATCTEPQTCTVCGETQGEALGHDWSEATCTEPQTCTVCGETQGEALGHTAGEWEYKSSDYVSATTTGYQYCQVCGEVMNTKNTSLSSLHKNGAFLFSGDELGERLDNILNEEFGDSYAAKVADVSEGVAIAVGYDSEVVALSMSLDSNGEVTQDKDERGSITSILVRFYDTATSENVAYIACAYIAAIDPSLSLSDAASLIKNNNSEGEVEENGITYIWGYISGYYCLAITLN
ncbi:MAG: hypothetical protein LUF34_05805 [Lachnospiraceae bacterium]|nr:hypothetical protein [Lachnospiraceae bacterium]